MAVPVLVRLASSPADARARSPRAPRDRAAALAGREALGGQVLAFGVAHHVAESDVRCALGEAQAAALAAHRFDPSAPGEVVHDLAQVVLLDVERRADLGDRRPARGVRGQVDERAQAVVCECGELHVQRAEAAATVPTTAACRFGRRSRNSAYTPSRTLPAAKTMSPGTRIHTSASITLEWMISGERANHRPRVMLACA